MKLYEDILDLKLAIDNFLTSISKEQKDSFFKSKNIVQHLTEVSSISSRYISNQKLLNIFILNLLKLHFNLDKILSSKEIHNIVGENVYSLDFSEKINPNKHFDLIDSPWEKYIANILGIQASTVVLGIWNKKIIKIDYSLENLINKCVLNSKNYKNLVLNMLFELYNLDFLILLFLYRAKVSLEFIEKNIYKIFTYKSTDLCVKIIPTIELEENELEENELEAPIEEKKLEEKELEAPIEENEVSYNKVVLDEDNNIKNTTKVVVIPD